MGKEIQRTLLWVILLGSLFLLWDNYQVYRGGTSFFASTEATQQASDVASVPADGVPTSEAAVGQETSEAQVVGNKAIYASGRTVEVVTDRLKVTFDLKGAKIVGAELTQIPRQASWTEVGLAGLILGRKPSENLGNVRLLEANDQRIYTAQSGLIGGNFPNHSDEFKLISKDLSMGDKDRLSVSFEAVKGGVRVVKTYSFSRNRYGIQLDTQIINESAQTVSPQIYYQIIRDDGKPEEEATNYSTFTGPAVYTSEDKFQKIPFEDIADQDASFAEKADNGWIAMVQHHFVSAWIPTQGEERQNYVRSLGDHVFALGSIVPLKTLATGQSEKTEALFYVGAPYSAQEISYRKLLGQFDDAGNTTTIAHYLDLLKDAGLMAGLRKYDQKPLKTRSSSPRLAVFDTGLMTATYGQYRDYLLTDPERKGRLVESAVGAYLMRRGNREHFNVYWWRDGNYEVDFVLQSGSTLCAIEVKSGRVKGTVGLDEFHQRFRPARSLVVGSDGCTLEDFLLGNVRLF